MDDITLKDGVWFIYDGECPLCNASANAYRLKQKLGALHLINARDSDAPSWLMDDIQKRNYSLDKGMVIFFQGKYYHGKDALTFMARHGSKENLFTKVCTALFQFSLISSLTYPFLRMGRNILLILRGKKQIKNLTD